jgi:hypothetical protein
VGRPIAWLTGPHHVPAKRFAPGNQPPADRQTGADEDRHRYGPDADRRACRNFGEMAPDDPDFGIKILHDDTLPPDEAEEIDEDIK